MLFSISLSSSLILTSNLCNNSAKSENVGYLEPLIILVPSQNGFKAVKLMVGKSLHMKHMNKTSAFCHVWYLGLFFFYASFFEIMSVSLGLCATRHVFH